MKYYLKVGQEVYINKNDIATIFALFYNEEDPRRRVQVKYKLKDPSPGMKKIIDIMLPLEHILPVNPEDQIVDPRVYSYCTDPNMAKVADLLNEIVITPKFQLHQKVYFCPNSSVPGFHVGEIIAIDIDKEGFLYTFASKDLDQPITTRFNHLGTYHDPEV